MAVAETEGLAAQEEEDVHEYRTRLWVRIERQRQPLPEAPWLRLRRCRWERQERVDAAIACVGLRERGGG